MMLFALTGCGKKGADDIIKDFDKKISSAKTYQVEGTLQITNNDDTYNYDVTASFEKTNKYRVSLVNTSNNHEQIILKNEEAVYVLTPSLNKKFKFRIGQYSRTNISTIENARHFFRYFSLHFNHFKSNAFKA